MKLSELQGPFLRRKIITYARDHNTTVKKNKELQQIQGSLYKGKNNTDDYGQVTTRIYVFYEDLNIGMDVGSIYYPEEKDVDEVVSRVSPALLQGPHTFIEALDYAVEAVRRITNAEIELARHIAPDKVPIYIEARQRAHDKDEERRAAERAEREAEDAAHCEKYNLETQRIIDAALHTLQHGGILKNDVISFYSSRYACSSYKIINYLARQYDVQFPLKVQGWINKSLVQVTIHNGEATQYRYAGGKSSTFLDYMDKLLDAVRQGKSEGGAA